MSKEQEPDSDPEDLDFEVDEESESGSDDSQVELNPPTEEETTERLSERRERVQKIWDDMKLQSTNLYPRKSSILAAYKARDSKPTLHHYEFAGEKYSTHASNMLGIPSDPNADNKEDTLPTISEPCNSHKRKFRKSRLPELAIKYGVAESIRLNTLEKSKLDWNKFVVEEGIQEELKMKNKDGYMEKLDFLHRTDERQADIIDNMKNVGKRR